MFKTLLTLVTLGCLTVFAFVLSTVAGTAAAQTPRTPWGHPDLQGTYTNATQTPFERPEALSDKAFLTEEEAELVNSRFGHRPAEAVVGVGCDLAAEGDGDRFRTSNRLGDAPFLLSIGRVDPWKGSLEAADYFLAFKERNPSDLRLVIVGESPKPVFTRREPVHKLAESQGIVDVFISGTLEKVPLYQREHMSPGDTLDGPAVVAQSDCTTCVPPDISGQVDGYGNLILTVHTL